MCFTVNVNLIKDELESRYGAEFPDDARYQPSYYYHAYALPDLPALCSGTPGRIKLLKWGLIPSWTKNEDAANEIRYMTFNARAESVSTKPSFSRAFKKNRCIIPVAGFFEWQHFGGKKIPWYIYPAAERILSLAGLYDSWVETTTGAELATFSIITSDANELMAEIHNSKKRMPVILDRSDEKRWLSLSTTEDEALSMLRPCPSGVLKAHTISNLINDKLANRNTPDLILPFERPELKGPEGGEYSLF